MFVAIRKAPEPKEVLPLVDSVPLEGRLGLRHHVVDDGTRQTSLFAERIIARLLKSPPRD
ncbi:hypothetical protein AJ78_08173 [Emergomyces pasteurianus Ep9510]|uniref:Uncharacterized protein n=1 Tax=Emergomyces pasteurianus Ep9510 TaxID=1447872 RepID=A0A1J9Q3X0_9EURO|nr:hypothetical protein AJ78_08173 [Emergomyces pasteurianus Ep9510]